MISDHIKELMFKALIGKHTVAEGAELDKWKAENPQHEEFLANVTNMAWWVANEKKCEVSRERSWVHFKKKILMDPHFTGVPVPWPHKNSQRWLLEQLKDTAMIVEDPDCNLADIEFCINASIEEMVIKHMELKHGGSDGEHLTINIVLDLLSAAYNTELLDGLPTPDGKALLQDLLKTSKRY